MDQAEDLAFCRGLFDEIISITAPADSNAIDPGHVIGALEIMKDSGDIQPEVVVDLQNLLSKVRVKISFGRRQRIFGSPDLRLSVLMKMCKC